MVAHVLSEYKLNKLLDELLARVLVKTNDGYECDNCGFEYPEDEIKAIKEEALAEVGLEVAL